MKNKQKHYIYNFCRSLDIFIFFSFKHAFKSSDLIELIFYFILKSIFVVRFTFPNHNIF